MLFILCRLLVMDGVKPDDGDEGFAEDNTPDDELVPMDVNLTAGAEGEDEVLNGPRATVFYTTGDQGEEKEFSKEEVEEMMKSDAYQRKIDTCHLCGKCWYDGNSSQSCRECGGFPLQRPCPICDGRCKKIWTRNVKSSHSFHEAHWEGTCNLPQNVQRAYFLEKFTDSSEQVIMEGMQDLKTT
uniref:Protein pinocchio n=2 Tax=Magallana gigas TaxID=29159 RepID=A0A8W8MU91_MAGGI